MLARGDDGIAYDVEFCVLKADCPWIEWGEHRGALVRRKENNRPAKQPGKPVNQFSPYQSSVFQPMFQSGGFHPQGQASVSQPQSQPAGFLQKTCNYYNSQNGCRRPMCKFAHVCNICMKPNHARMQCFRLNKQKF